MVGVASTAYTDPALNNEPIVDYMLKVKEEHAQKQAKDYSHVFRLKSRFDFIRLSCIVVGIEFAYAAETAFVSPILLKIGIQHEHMTMVWGLSPLLGFFLAPLLGSISDRCRLGFGRRRPIIILLSIGILAGLLLVPYGKELGIMLGDTGYKKVPDIILDNTYSNISNFGVAAAFKAPENEEPTFNFKYAVILTILGTILLDFDADTCQTPARAYLLDVCLPKDHAKALSTFTIMAGLGGTCGYTLGGIDWSQTEFGTKLGGNIPTVFTLVTVIFIICFFITITSFREIPLPLIENDELMRPLSAVAIKKEIAKNNNAVYYIKETSTLELKMSDHINEHNHHNDTKNNDPISLCESFKLINYGGINGTPAIVPPITISNDKETTLSISSSSDDDEFERISLGKYLKSIVIMPKSMRILCLTNLITWMSHVCYCLYFTDFVGEAVFGGNPSSNAGQEKNSIYEEGVRFGCWGLAIYALSCSIYSMCVEKLLKLFRIRTVYMGGMITYATGMLILAIWPTKIGVLVLSTTAGIIYATLFTIPYILVARYHARGCFKIKKGENIPLQQSRGLGTDIAIISSMVFIAQLIVSLSIGTLVSWLNSTCAVLYAASGLSLMAAISAFFVLYLD